MATSKTRKITSDELKKLQKNEKIRNTARRKAQKVGKSIATDKSKPKTTKPTRPVRKVTKKRASIR
ncbi:MAG: hypothetical protein ACE5RR_00275 [Nitrosarchaeum sp.]